MNKLIDVINMLENFRKSDTGCAWTQSQSLQSLAPQTIEEAYELAEAAELNDAEHLKSELGDILYHFLFYLIIAEEQQLFNLDDVCDDIIAKHDRRMPNEQQRENFTAEQVNEYWEQLKIQERAQQQSAFDAIPKNFPALTRSLKLQKRAVESGFETNDINQTLAQIQKKLDNIKQEINTNAKENYIDTIGELLFSVANLSRQVEVDSEAALRRANRRYEAYFREKESALPE